MDSKNILYYIFSPLRWIMYPLALLYGGIMWLRNRMYDSGFFTSIGFSVPVISVGNLSTGGTGKTPHVEYLVRLLQYQYRAATMSRGYKRHTQGFLIADAKANALRIGDEPMQYHIKFPELVVSVAEERLTGIPYLLQRRPDIDVIVLDDAYQHRSVKAGLNMLITDYSRPFYKDYVLPFGSLREGRGAYKRADVIIVSKCPSALTAGQAEEITRSIAPKAHQQVFFTHIEYHTPFNMFTYEPEQLAGKNVVLVCGIARPEPLVSYIEQFAAAVHTLSYKDHHYFVSSDLDEIQKACDNWQVDNKIILTTEKDAARLYLHAARLSSSPVPIVVLPIVVNVLFGKEQELNERVLRYVEAEIAANNPEPPPQSYI